MKFEIPKTTRFLPLQEYDPENRELAGVGIQVWVDPPFSVQAEFDNLTRNYRQTLEILGAKISAEFGKVPVKPLSLSKRLLSWIKYLGVKGQNSRFKTTTKNYQRSMYIWYARLWSQSLDIETHWTVEELEKINKKNPQLYEWLCISSWILIKKHREDVKKGFRGLSGNLHAPERPATPSLQPSSSPSTSTPPPAGP